MKIKKETSYALHALTYMTRHLTQLPVTLEVISKAEGISQSYLSGIFKKLTKAGIVKPAPARGKGYLFADTPSRTSLLELFELMEGGPLFKECFMKNCQCGGTPENCRIYGIWQQSTKKILDVLKQTSLGDAAWSCPEHRFENKLI